MIYDLRQRSINDQTRIYLDGVFGFARSDYVRNGYFGFDGSGSSDEF